MDFLKSVKNFFFGKQKEKVKERDGVLGHYDSKPYHNFRYALAYAGDVNVNDTKPEDDIEIFTRVYKDVTFVNILVNNDVEINVDDYSYDKMKALLIEKELTATSKSVCVLAFQHYTKNAVEACLNYCKSDKNHFYQGMVYNPELVQMDYFMPVPKYHSRMYDMLAEDLYFDFAFLDLDRE